MDSPWALQASDRFKDISDPVEYVERYEPGGLPPVYLGDTFHDGRYRILRKLGYGSYCTVWLAIDQSCERYVALKLFEARRSTNNMELEILTKTCEAQSSTSLDKFCPWVKPTSGKDHIITLLDNFEHHSQNGIHLCLVLEVMGPSVRDMLNLLEPPGSVLRVLTWKRNRPAPKKTQAATQVTTQMATSTTILFPASMTALMATLMVTLITALIATPTTTLMDNQMATLMSSSMATIVSILRGSPLAILMISFTVTLMATVIVTMVIVLVASLLATLTVSSIEILQEWLRICQDISCLAMTSCINNALSKLNLTWKKSKPNLTGYPLWMVKEMARQTLLGLDFLHRQGITHAELHQGNILFMVSNLADVPEKDLQQDFGEQAISERIERVDGEVDMRAPHHLFVPQVLAKYVPIETEINMKLVDFGSAFYTSSPPEKVLTPLGLRAPELILGGPVDEKIDIWAFGCLVIEFLTGHCLFSSPSDWLLDMSEEETDDQQLIEFIELFGTLPPCLCLKWRRRSLYIDDCGKLKSYDPEDEYFDSEGERIKPSPNVQWSKEKVTLKEKLPGILDEKEVAELLDLARTIFKYNPRDRPTASELLLHPWFQK